MSHSKYTKRGYSLYIENWNCSAKKYINTCVICGHKGYSAVIECKDFCDSLKNKLIYKELTKILSEMQLDELGRIDSYESLAKYPEMRECMQKLLEQGEKITRKQWKAEIQSLQAEYDSIGKEKQKTAT